LVSEHKSLECAAGTHLQKDGTDLHKEATVTVITSSFCILALSFTSSSSFAQMMRFFAAVIFSLHCFISRPIL
jgi:hypothetical protein